MQYAERYLKEFHRVKASARENRFQATDRLNLFEIILVSLPLPAALLSPPELKTRSASQKLSSIRDTRGLEVRTATNARRRTVPVTYRM